jgi:hypothetical protein
MLWYAPATADRASSHIGGIHPVCQRKPIACGHSELLRFQKPARVAKYELSRQSLLEAKNDG